MLFLSLTAHANEYMAEVKSVYDGDTIKVSIELWPGLTQRVSVRIKGIDTPESRTKSTCEKLLASEATMAIRALLGARVRIVNVVLGKFAGRVLADVYTLNNIHAGNYMLTNGFAREYHGGKRVSWCVD